MNNTTEQKRIFLKIETLKISLNRIKTKLTNMDRRNDML